MRIHGLHFGIKGDGVTDDTAALLAALISRQPISLYGLRVRVTQPIILNDDHADLIDVDGGHPSRSAIIFDGLTETHLEISDLADVRLRNLTICCTGTQTGSNYGVHLRRCDRPQLEFLHVLNPDNVGILLFECSSGSISHCHIENTSKRYEAGATGTAIQLAGCSFTIVRDCYARRTNFSFSCLGKEYTDNAESTPGEPITRPVRETLGNVFLCCHAEEHWGTAFNANGIDGVRFLACTAAKKGGVSTHPTFQFKDPKNRREATRYNAMIGCHADVVYSGFYEQGGSLNLWQACTVHGADRFGFRFNLAANCVVSDCIAGDVSLKPDPGINGAFVVRQSEACIVDGCVVALEPDCSPRAALVSVEMTSAHTTIGNVSSGGKAPIGISVARDADLTRVLDGCLCALDTAVTPVVDKSRTTVWGK
jgi:hypothetical protein